MKKIARITKIEDISLIEVKYIYLKLLVNELVKEKSDYSLKYIRKQKHCISNSELSEHIRKIANYNMTEIEKINCLNDIICGNYFYHNIYLKALEYYNNVVKNANSIVGCFSKFFNNRLYMLYKIPILLYYVGNISILNDSKLNYIGVVGSRKPSRYSMRVCSDIVSKIPLGNIIVSGLAKGIDGISHNTSLKKSGNNIAVIGSGISKKSFYPKENSGLFKRIISSGGLVISEYPPNMHGTRYTFPERNRIIAALSDDVIIIQARHISGSMHTANFALELGKNIYVPVSNIYDSDYAGSHRLISEGAIPITDISFICEYFK